MKTNADKKVNRRIRALNKQLVDDVFGLRFWIRQYQKAKVDGISYYLFEMCDREQPERNEVINRWFNEFSVITFHEIEIELNNFIISSDFWSRYGQYQRQLKEQNK